MPESGIDEVWRSLQQAYAGLGDDELLRLAAQRGGLTEVAQDVLDAEMRTRGLKVAVPEGAAGGNEFAVALAPAADDPSQVLLWYFPVVSEAWTAADLLQAEGIEVRVEKAYLQQTGAEPVLSEELEREKTAWYGYKGVAMGRLMMPGVNLYIDRARQAEAVRLLREKMGLFPAAESGSTADDDEGDDFFPVGEFGSAADFETAKGALSNAGIPFRTPADEENGLEVRFEDLDRAVEIIGESLSA